MKQQIRKIASFFMALVVLFSTMSFTIDMHFCGNTIVDTAIFQKARSCGMQIQNPSSKACAFTKNNCCRNKQLVKEAQEEIRAFATEISFEQHIFITSFIHSEKSLYQGIDKALSFHLFYKPPPFIRQLYKIDETYII
jgi:hypothetical protein